jgi:hypothetical protein
MTFIETLKALELSVSPGARRLSCASLGTQIQIYHIDEMDAHPWASKLKYITLNK